MRTHVCICDQSETSTVPIPDSGQFVSTSRFCETHWRSCRAYIAGQSIVVMKHVPNALTITRILVTPIMLVLLFQDSLVAQAWALGLFVYASVSDWADGLVARHFDVGTRFGQFLDPVADKVLTLGTFFVLSVIMPENVPLWLVLMVALRDVVVTVYRLYIKRRGATLTTSRRAKWKTAAQLTFLISLLVIMTAARTVEPVVGWMEAVLTSSAVFWAMVIVTAVTVWTGIDYFTRPEITQDAASNGS